MIDSEISWTDNTWNPWIGCTRVSAECDRCYAASTDARYGYTPHGWGRGKPRKLTSAQNWSLPIRWNREAGIDGIRRKVFCASLADVFDTEVPDEWRARLFELIDSTPQLDWQLLTKRANQIRPALEKIGVWKKLPLPNVWLGFSAGNQKFFDLRWPLVREVPALVRFVSYEPALGPLRLPLDVRGNLHWLIAGGETSMRRNESRHMEPDWARSVRSQCHHLGVAFWFKQTGNRIKDETGEPRWYGKSSTFYKEHYELLDGVKHQEFPQIAAQ